jgi:hypothetical protein
MKTMAHISHDELLVSMNEGERRIGYACYECVKHMT